MKAIAYVRVSTEDQAAHGVSLEAQKDKIRAYAELYSIEIAEIIEDGGYSAKNMLRPGMQRVLEMMRRREVEGVIVAKLDRLTRSVRDLSDIIELANKKTVSLVSVNEHIDTGTAAGRMIVNMLAVISQWERETIGERTATAIHHKRANGQSYSSRFALYGYRKRGGYLVPVDLEQATIGLVMLLSKEYSYAEIARRLEKAGHRPRGGGKWHRKTIRKIVQDAPARESISAALKMEIAA
ncbi:MAG: recombinase family protein [Chitinivibrionales bacterium]|nr:recombinase family protein [Chitinivibrionales bacterium]MBD3396857.1 recombinase family protein [Chitinivibrionales bacterium]